MESRKGSNSVLMRTGIEGIKCLDHYYLRARKLLVLKIFNTQLFLLKTLRLKIIAEIWKVGRDGVITVDESNDFETTLEARKVCNDKGYISP